VNSSWELRLLWGLILLGIKIDLGLTLSEKWDYFECKSFWGLRGILGLTFFGNKAIMGGFVLLGFILHGVNIWLANLNLQNKKKRAIWGLILLGNKSSFDQLNTIVCQLNWFRSQYV